MINAHRLYEVQKYVAATNHQYNLQAVIVSKKLGDTLGNDERKDVPDGRSRPRYQRAAEAEFLRRLAPGSHTAPTGQTVDLSAH